MVGTLAVASSGFDPTSIATLVLAGITLAVALATVLLAMTTRAATAQAREDTRKELRLLERQLCASHRPLIVDVLVAAPVPSDIGPLQRVQRAEDPNAIPSHGDPVIETRFPGRETSLFDPRSVFVAVEGGKVYISVPLRNVGRGLAVIDGSGVELEGPAIGGREYRMVERYHVPVSETTRIDLIADYRTPEADAPRGLVWHLAVPYTDFAGEQRTTARLQIVCRSDQIQGPWFVERVEQVSPAEQRPASIADQIVAADEPAQGGTRRAEMTDIWGQPLRRPGR